MVTLDLSSRYVRDVHRDRQGMQYDAGLDFYTKLGAGRRDIATVAAQVYFSRIHRHPAAPGIYDAATDEELIFKINTINFHLTEDRSVNLKLGHFEVPYGLEATLNTAGELRSFTRSSNTGLGADWGATLNGTLSRLQYEFGLSRGSGLSWSSHLDPFALSAHVGTPVDYEGYLGVSGWGLSFFRGRVLNPRKTATLLRERFGIDWQYYHGPFGFLAEVSSGQNGTGAGRARVLGGLAEVNVSNPRDTLSGFVQLVTERQKTRTTVTRPSNLVAGVRWAPDGHWTLSLQREESVWRLPRVASRGMFYAQARYRF